MAGNIFEWYGYPATDQSPAARASAQAKHCPFLDGDCIKKGGVCSVTPAAGGDNVVVCPSRLYGDRHRFLRLIASVAFERLGPHTGPDGLPSLLPGREARTAAVGHGAVQIGVFGAKPWSGEIKLPPAMPGGARYSVDFVLIAVSPGGTLMGFVPVEVQAIDTTNSYAASLAALQQGRTIQPSKFGMNWENVNKRILPQLIVKGLMLQAERLCLTGIYFVTPEPVFSRIMLRLGGMGRLREVPPQPGSITFVRYDYTAPLTTAPGTPLDLAPLPTKTVSTSDMSLAFITPENLPPGGSYEAEIQRRI